MELFKFKKIKKTYDMQPQVSQPEKLRKKQKTKLISMNYS